MVNPITNKRHSSQKGMALLSFVFVMALLAVYLLMGFSSSYIFAKEQRWGEKHKVDIQNIGIATRVFYEATCAIGPVTQADLNGFVNGLDYSNLYGSNFNISVQMLGGIAHAVIETTYITSKYQHIASEKSKEYMQTSNGLSISYRIPLGINTYQDSALQEYERFFELSLVRAC